MIFPRGEVRHQNLLTAYTDLTSLISTLKLENFSGTIEIEFPETSGILFIDSGEVISGEAKVRNDSKRTIGQEAIQSLLAFSKQKDGVLNVYQLTPERVAIVASHIKHEILFKGLSTDFTRLDRLLLKLKEEKHNGFIEILTKENQAMGVLFLEEGDPSEMFTLSETGNAIFGRKSISTFVENASKQGAIFNVYRSQNNVSMAVATVPTETALKETVPTETEPKEERGVNQMIPIFQEILSKAETLVDDLSRQKGFFRKVFKRSLIEKSERFSFLDPFGGDFDYRERTLRFTGEVDEKDFARGMVECFQTTLSLLNKALPKQKMLPLKLRAELESTLERHRETLKRLGIDKVFSSFLE